MNLRPCLICGCLLAAAFCHAAESGFSVDWEHVALDAQPSDESRLVASGYPEGTGIVNAQTDPANPFSDIGHALHVKSVAPQAQWFRLHFRPFVGPPVATGAVVVQFQLGKNAVTVQVGSNELPWDSANRESFAVTRSFFNAAFSPEDGISIQGRPLRTNSIEWLEAGKPYTLLIKWDFSLPEPLCTFYLDGEAIQDQSGEVFSWKIAEPGPEPGINAFRITLGNNDNPEGEFFLGRLQGVENSGDIRSEQLPH